ncbi:MAG: AMP-binding protein [Ilumatobacteraceae bacterium]
MSAPTPATGACPIACNRPTIDLHPDLGLLMSTSGSTGNPKLVRLATANLRTERVVDRQGFQHLTDADVGITSLPLYYSFGLSILHSHLVVGGSVVVTDTSVVDPCFRRLLLEHDVTNLAGVPHVRSARPSRARAGRSPALRFLAQAGGKMARAWRPRGRPSPTLARRLVLDVRPDRGRLHAWRSSRPTPSIPPEGFRSISSRWHARDRRSRRRRDRRDRLHRPERDARCATERADLALGACRPPHRATSVASTRRPDSSTSSVVWHDA